MKTLGETIVELNRLGFDASERAWSSGHKSIEVFRPDVYDGAPSAYLRPHEGGWQLSFGDRTNQLAGPLAPGWGPYSFESCVEKLNAFFDHLKENGPPQLKDGTLWGGRHES